MMDRIICLTFGIMNILTFNFSNFFNPCPYALKLRRGVNRFIRHFYCSFESMSFPDHVAAHLIE